MRRQLVITVLLFQIVWLIQAYLLLLPGLKCALVCYECDTGRLPESILEGMFFVGTEDGHLKEGGILANWWLADIDLVQTNVSSFYTDEGGFLYNPAQRLFGLTWKDRKSVV